MSSCAINSPLQKGDTKSAWVWFGGATALLEGQGVCYDWDRGDAAVVDPSRFNRVEVPTILNAPYFAGVAARSYSAQSSGQLIEIFLPGSTCSVLARATAVIGVGVLTCEAGGTYAGYFRYAGFEGRGSCVPAQTLDTVDAAAKLLARLQDGPESGLVDVITLAADSAAVTCMVGGVTVFAGVAMTGAHATFTMADGTKAGQRKKFVCAIELGDTYDAIVTVNGIQLDGSTALQTIILDDADEEDTVEWNGDWYEKGRKGCTVS